MKSHICILICYNNTEHIINCFESLKLSNVDFFIIENQSKNSADIETYFRKQKLVGYIQFELNITFRAVERFIKDYHDLINSYDYITISDCDLQVQNPTNVFSELIKNLNLPNVGISCIDLSLDNFPHHIPNSNSWLPSPYDETEDYIEAPTGVHLCTLKKENLHLFHNTFIDQHILSRTYKSKLKWVKTKKNKAKHLTWDLYHEGNEYYEFKKMDNTIWNHSLTSNYKIII
jgi:hypothetical protein